MRKDSSILVFFMAFSLLLAANARSAVVRVSGGGIIFEAANNEKNTVTLVGRLVDDPQFEGYVINDSTAQILTVDSTCHAVGGRVSCQVEGPLFVKLLLKDGDDSVIQPGGSVRMIVNGGSGNDTITGGGGDDDLDGDTGNDTIDGGAGNDLIRGGFGDDHLFGGVGNDRLIGGPGNDTLEGASGDDDLDGGLGDDHLIGGAGIDKFEGGPGDDVIEARDGNNETIRCGGGHDTVTKDPGDKTSRCN